MSLNSLLIANFTNATILYQYSNPTLKKDFTVDAKVIASKAKNLRSKLGQRDKLICDYGVWFVTRGQQDLLYAACVSDDFPQRVAFGLIQKMQVLIKQKSRSGQVQQAINKLKKQFGDLCEKHKDARVDKVRQAQFAVEDLRTELHKGVSKMIQNQDNLNQLNQKTVLMKKYAKSFQKQAEKAEQKMFCQKWKTYIIVGSVLGGILILAGIIIYLHLH